MSVRGGAQGGEPRVDRQERARVQVAPRLEVAGQREEVAGCARARTRSGRSCGRGARRRGRNSASRKASNAAGPRPPPRRKRSTWATGRERCVRSWPRRGWPGSAERARSAAAVPAHGLRFHLTRAGRITMVRPPTGGASGSRGRSRCAAAAGTTSRWKIILPAKKVTWGNSLATARQRSGRPPRRCRPPCGTRGACRCRWPAPRTAQHGPGALAQLVDGALALEPARVDHADRDEHQVLEVPGEGAEDVEHGVDAEAAVAGDQHRGRSAASGRASTRRRACSDGGRLPSVCVELLAACGGTGGSAARITEAEGDQRRGDHQRDPAALGELLEHRDHQDRGAQHEARGEQRGALDALRAGAPRRARPVRAASRTSTARTSGRR